jgi:hypothetical protein
MRLLCNVTLQIAWAAVALFGLYKCVTHTLSETQPKATTTTTTTAAAVTVVPGDKSGGNGRKGEKKDKKEPTDASTTDIVTVTVNATLPHPSFALPKSAQVGLNQSYCIITCLCICYQTLTHSLGVSKDNSPTYSLFLCS